MLKGYWKIISLLIHQTHNLLFIGFSHYNALRMDTDWTYTQDDLEQFDQIWVIDNVASSSSFKDMYAQPALDMIAQWYINRRDDTNIKTPHLILDGRFFYSSAEYFHSTTGEHFPGTVENPQIFINYYEALRLRHSGGLILATDHDIFARDANNYVAGLIGLSAFTGNVVESFMPIDASHPVINFPGMAAQTYDQDPVFVGEPLNKWFDLYIEDGSTTSMVPKGQQSGGQYLYVIAYHSRSY